ncbi:MAG: peptidoglycan DD-metalloendopeptidase family protein [Chloroflexi bacterium]|nr:peptidoglycan DD-metalloendopeptidase family protein [Chloroflexota bacterium]
MNSKRNLGGIFIVTAMLVVAAVLIVFLEPESDPEQIVNEPTVAPSLTPLPTDTLPPSLTPSITPTITPTASTTPLPTADVEIRETAVAMDISSGSIEGNVVERDVDAFTINEQPARAEVIQYEVQYGDSIYEIAGQFDVSLETIVWSNGTFFINALRPGMVLNILPVEGAMHTVDTPITVADLAEEYQVDPLSIINSEFNELRDATPESILPQGLTVVIEGGTGTKEPLYWDPRGGAGTTVNPAESRGNVYQGTAFFGSGQPGSCGQQGVYDGTVPTVRPVSGYVVTQDFTWTHSGLDMSANEGTPVLAAGTGTVIFAGWSEWGYGYAIVVSHGPVMTLYAHLTGAGFVWCGQHVEAGQHIGNVGSSGRSSGPHLHFEVRNADGIPQNPRAYLGFSACRGTWCAPAEEGQ